jgi:hypothetical protein
MRMGITGIFGHSGREYVENAISAEKKEDGWSSTKITNINNNIIQSITQPGGTFIIRTMKDVIRNYCGDRTGS